MKHMKHIHTEKQKEHKFGCTICDFKEDTEEQIVKHLSDVHNVDDIPKEKEDTKDVNCPLCDFSSKSEEQTIKHIEDVHKLVDESTSKKINKPCRYYRQKRCFKGQDCKFVHEETQESPNKKPTENTTKTCKHGIKCTFLKQNRCHFYHEVAAQPKKQSRPSEQQEQQPEIVRSDPRPTSGHEHKFRASLNQVNMCNDNHKCDRGRRCRFRHYSPAHYEVDFSQRSSNRKK